MDDKYSDISVDVRCSNACTRAGLTFLLFSTMAFSLVPVFFEVKSLNALIKYTDLRYNLKEAIAQLDTDPCWQFLIKGKDNEKFLKEWNIFTIIEHKCDSRLYLLPPRVELKNSLGLILKPDDNKKQKIISDRLKELIDFKFPSAYAQAPPAPPGAPGGLHLEWPIPEAVDIAEILTYLGDGKMLTLARSYSNHYSLAIYKWVRLIFQIFEENNAKKGIPTLRGPNITQQDSNFVPDLPSEILLKNLTLKNTRRLSDYEYPNLSELDQFIGGVQRISLPSLSVSVGINLATTFVEMVLLISLTYFWLYQREARISCVLFSYGTLFSIFFRDHKTFYIFIFLSLVPSFAAFTLAWQSFNYTNIDFVLAFAILWFSIQIILEANNIYKNRFHKIYLPFL